MKRSILFLASLGLAWAGQASALGWECNNEWGGYYKFTVTGNAVGVAHYEGPIDLADIITHTTRSLEGGFFNLVPFQQFDFYFPGFQYHCNVKPEGMLGSTYDCTSSVGNAPIKLNNCHGSL